MEIVIAQGAKFPYCPSHPKLNTKWKSITDEPLPQVNQLPSTGKKNNPAA
jgi:hypothetical protein